MPCWKKEKGDHCFPNKVSILLERRDGDPVLERQTADVTKSFYEKIGKKGRML